MVIGNMRYIEIDSIIEQIKAEHCERCTNHRCTLCDIDEVLILLEEADDADVEEVVRCKDCKHKGWVQEPCHGKTIYFCKLLEFCVRKNDFCSYGERKEI
jgi:hypothetical protein